MNTQTPSRFLFILAVLLAGLTTAMTLLGGIGTSCVAFAAEKWESMAPLVPVKPIFQVLVIISILAAFFGAYTTYQLSRSYSEAYRNILIFLGIGLAASIVQMYFSATLRGKTAPNNIRVYLTALTLLYFLILRLPYLWQKSGLNAPTSSKGSGRLAGGATLCLAGLLILTCPLWVSSTHFLNGYNSAMEFLWPQTWLGVLLLVAGLVVLIPAKKQQKDAFYPIILK